MKKQLILLFVLLTATVFGQVNSKKKPSDFVPDGFVTTQTLQGDLNKDGIEDCVLIIKGTEEELRITDEYCGDLDLNRRGIIILFKQGNQYKLALKNEACFASEDEDGGVYFAPDLSVSYRKGTLYFHFAHGRYGAWGYTFRYQNDAFELIGYDNMYRSQFVSDWVAFDETSVNFSTKKKLQKEIVSISKDGKETYKEIWSEILLTNRLNLAEISQFDDLMISDYYQSKEAKK